MLIVIAIVIIVVYCVSLSVPDTLPESSSYNRGYGLNEDSVDTLVSRIAWSNHYKARIYTVPKILVTSAALGVIALTCVQNKLPSGIDLARFVFVSTIILTACGNYLSHHGEKFPHYAIDRNVKLLQKKLGLQNSLPDRNLEIFSPASDCWNFFFEPI